MAHQAILFILDVLIRNNQAMLLVKLYDSFADRTFTPQMLRAVGGNEQGLQQFLLRYPSLFTVNNDTVSANSATPVRTINSSKSHHNRPKSTASPASSSEASENDPMSTSMNSNHNNNNNSTNETIWDAKTMREIEQEAINFFKKQLSKREEEWLPIVSVAGHASQASADVRKYVGPQNEFKMFLSRYPTVFIVRDEFCGLKVSRAFRRHALVLHTSLSTQGQSRSAGNSLSTSVTSAQATRRCLELQRQQLDVDTFDIVQIKYPADLRRHFHAQYAHERHELVDAALVVIVDHGRRPAGRCRQKRQSTSHAQRSQGGSLRHAPPAQARPTAPSEHPWPDRSCTGSSRTADRIRTRRSRCLLQATQRHLSAAHRRHGQRQVRRRTYSSEQDREHQHELDDTAAIHADDANIGLVDDRVGHRHTHLSQVRHSEHGQQRTGLLRHSIVPLRNVQRSDLRAQSRRYDELQRHPRPEGRLDSMEITEDVATAKRASESRPLGQYEQSLVAHVVHQRLRLSALVRSIFERVQRLRPARSRSQRLSNRQRSQWQRRRRRRLRRAERRWTSVADRPDEFNERQSAQPARLAHSGRRTVSTAEDGRWARCRSAASQSPANGPTH